MQIMDQQRYSRIKEVFQEICDRPLNERSALIDSACGDDLDLRIQVEQLLAHQDMPAIDFDEVASEIGELLNGAAAAVHRPAPVPERIGPYRIIRLIGEGGMGAVYLAEQAHPKRLLAVKVIKPGLGPAAAGILRRFEHEAQTLARLQHPGIARIYDAGTIPPSPDNPGSDGCPYLAMEFVDGVPINEYCDSRRMTIKERLELFMAVGEAVHHAHMRGVIHRDLKPSNILVAEHDEPPSNGTRNSDARNHRPRPWPRVIDFGVAKALHPTSPNNQFLATNPGVLVGTLAYMSPEQARSDGSDVDVRSDVYALGVVLYQILAGVLPVDQARLRRASAADRERLLWESPLPRPSSRVSRLISTDDETAVRIALNRRAQPAPLVRQMKGELDWIVMTALSPERERRYGSVGALLDDLRRYLRDEPVLARPPSAMYLARKFARRNRGLVAGAAAFLAALVLGIVGTTWGLVHAMAQQERAERESQRALAAEANAEQRAAELDQVVAFQNRQLNSIDAAAMGSRFREGILESIRGSNDGDNSPTPQPLDPAVIEQLLATVNFTTVALQVLNESIFDWALREIESRYTDQPLVQARLFQTMANTMRGQGLLDATTVPQMRAMQIRRDILGDEDPATLGSIIEAGRLLKIQGRLDEAEVLVREGMVGRRKHLGDEHPHTLYAINVVGFVLRAQGRLDEAEPYYREALAGFQKVHGDNHRSTLFSLANMGSLLRNMGRLDEAEPIIIAAVEGKRRRYGDDHIETVLSAIDLGLLLHAQGNLVDAEVSLQDTMERSQRLFGEEHFATLWSRHSLAVLLHEQGLLDAAEAHYRKALEGRRRTYGEDHSETQETARRLAALLEERRAMPALRESP